MRKTFLLLLVLFAVAAVALTPGLSAAQADSAISTTVVGDGVFVTVKETAAGDVLSLYRVNGERIILVDMVINSVQQSSMRLDLSNRYLHHLDVENK